MMRKRYTTATAMVLGLAVVMVAGCQQPRPSMTVVSAEVGGVGYDRLWDVSLEVLRRYNLVPDRQDMRAGVMTTQPVTCAQWFEVWRPEVVDSRSKLEASLHTIRRQAEVTFGEPGVEGARRVSVRVDVYRYSLPERQVTTASGALRIFSAKTPTLADGGGEGRWVLLGHDSHLEAELLGRIATLSDGGVAELASVESTPADGVK